MSEALSQQEFDTHLYEGSLTLSVVGMSNVGKSYWSNRLAEEANFNRLCCDDMIERKLGAELDEFGSTGGIADVALWMGLPFSPQFPANQDTYLEHEAHAMETIIDDVEAGWLTSNTVIDTTGSVVHLDRSIRERISTSTTVVYLEATPAMQQQMFDQFMSEPKPVVWKEMYAPRGGETDIQTLERCYPNLLARRSRLYQQMAHVTISREVLFDVANAEDFVQQVRKSLPKERVL